MFGRFRHKRSARFTGGLAVGLLGPVRPFHGRRTRPVRASPETLGQHQYPPGTGRVYRQRCRRRGHVALPWPQLPVQTGRSGDRRALGTKPKIHGVRNSQAPKTRLITSAIVSLFFSCSFSDCSFGRPPLAFAAISAESPPSPRVDRDAFRLALRPCRLAHDHCEHAVAGRRVHLEPLNFFHRDAALEAAILALAEQPISVFRLGRLFALKERRRIPGRVRDRIL